jgi:hypothetical protein
MIIFELLQVKFNIIFYGWLFNKQVFVKCIICDVPWSKGYDTEVLWTEIIVWFLFMMAWHFLKFYEPKAKWILI